MRKNLFWPFSAFCLYAFTYFALLFHPNMVRYDDFSYLQSAIETIARSQPFTHDWLEPYSATLSSLSALSYLVTGNFPFSTWGLEAVFVLANFILLYRLFRTRLISKEAATMTLLVLTQPIFWYKCSEFTSNHFTVTFVLAALLAYLRGYWIRFFIMTFLAFSNRQNSIVLLILPIYQLIRGGKDARKAVLLSGLLAFGALALVLHGIMNHTLAQATGIYAKLDGYRIKHVMQAMLVGAYVSLAFLSIFDWLMGSNARANFKDNIRRPVIPTAATAIFILMIWLGSLPLIDFHTPFIGSLDHTHTLQYILMVFLPCTLWFLDWNSIEIRPSFLLGCAYIIVSSMKGFWYDAYLIDLALAVLIYLLTREQPRSLSRLSLATITAALSLNLVWAYGFKIMGDKEALSNRVYEQLEREGKAEVENMTDATFGFLGWKLFDHYTRYETIQTLWSFTNYVRKERIVLESELPWRRSFKRQIPAEAEVLAIGRARIGFFQLRYRAMDLHVKGDQAVGKEEFIPLDKEKYRTKILPLNRAEWKNYITARQSDQRGDALR